MNRADLGSFNITEINTSGEKKVNFKIRNKLLFDSKEKNQKKKYNFKFGVYKE